MAWTNFPTWTVGQVSTASDWNTYVAANMQTLATPPIMRCYRNGALTVANENPAPYDTVNFDSASGYSVSTFKYLTPVAGYYFAYAQWGLNAYVDTDQMGMQLYLSGVQTSGNGWRIGGVGAFIMGITDLIGPCTAGTSTINAGYSSTGGPYATAAGSIACYMFIQKESN